MKKSFILLAVCLLAFVCASETASAQKVYSVEYASQADVKVYVVEYESQADLVVYKVDYPVNGN